MMRGHERIHAMRTAPRPKSGISRGARLCLNVPGRHANCEYSVLNPKLLAKLLTKLCLCCAFFTQTVINRSSRDRAGPRCMGKQ
jgi:hypothetical protein